MEKINKAFREQAGIILGGTTTSTCSDVEEHPLTLERIMEAIDSMPPPPPPSPIPTRFTYAPHMPKHIGLIISNDTHMPVGTILWVNNDNVEIAVLHDATNTYAQCGYDVYEVIMRKLGEDGLLLSGMLTNIVYKGVDTSP